MKIHFLRLNAKARIQMGLLLMCIGVMSLQTACNSDDTTSITTFHESMMGDYLRSSADYSEFVKLLDTTSVMGLLNAYGEYTCFAPTNDAMHKFYLSRGKASLKDFTPDTLKVIAYDHIIKGSVVMFAKLGVGRLNDLTMSDRYISISIKGSFAFVNEKSKIIDKDITVHNGVIHEIDEVINPTKAGITEAISQDSTKFSLFYKVLIATELYQKLLKDRDRTYDPTNWLNQATDKSSSWSYREVPLTRKFGYTVLMESDSVLALNNIKSFDDLKAYAKMIYDETYPEDAGVSVLTNAKNSLNRFVAYHLIDKQLSYSKFIDAYDIDHMIKTKDMYEYIETMCPNTLIEVKKDRLRDQTTFLMNFTPSDQNYVQIDKTYYDKDATNGVYHGLTGMLVYSKAVADMMSSKRLRFDAASFFPELTNNNMRGRGCTLPNLGFILPPGYVDRIKASEQTLVGYLTPYYMFQDYEGDEIFLNASNGKLYDFSITTPPIPKGTYEVRFGYLTNGKRGVAQLYFDGAPAGVPLNLNNDATHVDIGYEKPGSVKDDPFGFENDKMMRNRGFMKGPACYKVPTQGWSYGENARYSEQILRKILGTYKFNSDGTHVLTVKGLSAGEFMFDFLEFVPTSVLETEDIY